MSGLGTFFGLLVVSSCALALFAVVFAAWVRLAVFVVEWLEARGAPEPVVFAGLVVVFGFPVVVGIAFAGAMAAAL